MPTGLTPLSNETAVFCRALAGRVVLFVRCGKKPA